MHERQRTILVIASGLVLAVVATALNRYLSYDDGGWFAYAPNTSQTFRPGLSRSAIWREAAVWLGAIAAWSGVSLWLYRRPGSD